MSKYRWESWPPTQVAGMHFNSVPSGVKVTDTETGHFHCCAIHRSQHQNIEAAIAALKALDSEAHEHIRKP